MFPFLTSNTWLTRLNHSTLKCTKHTRETADQLSVWNINSGYMMFYLMNVETLSLRDMLQMDKGVIMIV